MVISIVIEIKIISHYCHIFYIFHKNYLLSTSRYLTTKVLQALRSVGCLTVLHCKALISLPPLKFAHR
jgi:hypothetical protein